MVDTNKDTVGEFLSPLRGSPSGWVCWLENGCGRFPASTPKRFAKRRQALRNQETEFANGIK